MKDMGATRPLSEIRADFAREIARQHIENEPYQTRKTRNQKTPDLQDAATRAAVKSAIATILGVGFTDIALRFKRHKWKRAGDGGEPRIFDMLAPGVATEQAIRHLIRTAMARTKPEKEETPAELEARRARAEALGAKVMEIAGTAVNGATGGKLAGSHKIIFEDRRDATLMMEKAAIAAANETASPRFVQEEPSMELVKLIQRHRARPCERREARRE
ncbi:MAG: hypothetical protein V1708_03340 [Candidatus Micrarchaeota archaeon]